MIFGVEDEAIIPEDNVFLKKSAHVNYDAIQISDFVSPQTTVHIFGHSMGLSDRSYFQAYFDSILYNETKARHLQSSINLYYYGDESLDSLNMRIQALTYNKIYEFKQKVKLKYINTSIEG